ncbi:hypothetical protein [Cedecea davisae]|uniref:hypothetical protein n=1 Tax=Cedecea davisae TaxID=158484 RepID=UPI0024319885|nr:hypothetical protein [Cedecea davisae]
MKVILYLNYEHPAVIFPSEELNINDIANSSLSAGKEYWVVECDNLPMSIPINAWELNFEKMPTPYISNGDKNDNN